MGLFFSIMLFIFVGLMSLYILIITVVSWFPSKSYNDVNEVKNKKKSINLERILVLIPAYNEELSIKRALASLFAMANESKSGHKEYAMQVMVIADNCTDDTAALAVEAGAKVVIKNDFVDETKKTSIYNVKKDTKDALLNSGKGQALDWFLKKYNDIVDTSDYVVIIDADSIVKENFMQSMLNIFQNTSIQVAQSFYDVLNTHATWRTSLLSIALRTLHHTRAKGRVFLGGSSGLKGNGMMFRSSLLQKYGWPAHSIAEDAEFSAMLAYDTIAVHYVEETAVYGEMPYSHKNASNQRARWENGHWLVVKTWLPRFLKQFYTKPTRLGLDSIINCIIPPLSIVVLLQIVNILVMSTYWHNMQYIASIFLLITASYIVSSLIQTKAPLLLYMALFFSPVYILWKIWIYMSKIGRNLRVWSPSARKEG